jgi:DNA polymerase-3 subunit delta
VAKKEDEKLNYSAAIRELKQYGPENVYLLWGPEDYLREQYLTQLKKICLPEGEDSFSYHRMDGPELNIDELSRAIDAMPFMTERTFIELRDMDINKIKDVDDFTKVLEGVPDYCVVVFILSAQYELDGRLKAVKGLRKIAKELKFTNQSQGLLIDWLVKRFGAAGKRIELDAAQRLIFISGDLMSGLIPEIEKVAAYAKGEKVTVADVEAVANHIPEAVIFDMTEYIAQKKYNTALAVLAELLSDKNNEPIPMLAMLGLQMRKLYAARLAIDQELGVKYLMDVCSIKYDYVAKKLLNAARGYTLQQLIRAVELCTEADFKMKSSAQDQRELLKEVVLRIAAGEKTHAKS